MRQISLAIAFMSMTIIAYNPAFCSEKINEDLTKTTATLTAYEETEQSSQQNTIGSERNTAGLNLEQRIAKLEKKIEAGITPIKVSDWKNRAYILADKPEPRQLHYWSHISGLASLYSMEKSEQCSKNE